MSRRVRATWVPAFYNLDQSIAVGRREVFAFSRRPGAGVLPADDLVFATFQDDVEWWSATVVAIEHPHLGAVDAVETERFGRYTVRFVDGRWLVVGAEEGAGFVTDVSPGLPPDLIVDARVRARRVSRTSWVLSVVLEDVAAAAPPG